MIFYKIAGALMVLISGVAGACFLNRTLNDTKLQTEGLEELVRGARGYIECYSLPACEVFERFDKVLLQKCGYKRDLPPNDFVDFFEEIYFLDKATREVVKEFAYSFGNCYREEQIRWCDRCIEALDGIKRSMVIDIPKRKKMNSTLCISSALAIIIVFA